MPSSKELIFLAQIIFQVVIIFIISLTFLAALAFPIWRLWSSGMIGACGSSLSFREKKGSWASKEKAAGATNPQNWIALQKALDPSPIQQPFFLCGKKGSWAPKERREAVFNRLKMPLLAKISAAALLFSKELKNETKRNRKNYR